MIINKYPNTQFIINGKEHLYFGGTDYLGMQYNTEFIKIVSRNLKKWGTAYGSSRNSNIKLAIYPAFETYFATFLKQEASLSISSCTLANRIINNIVQQKKITAFHVPNSHSSVIFDNSSPVFIDKFINPTLTSDSKEEIIITTDSILTLQTEVTNFDFLNTIHKNKNITLLIDESHSLGVLGKKGMGISTSINHPIIKRKIVVSSLSKTFGVSGGIIASDKAFIDGIKQNDLFIGAAGANPAFLQSIIDAKELYAKQLLTLQENMSFFYNNLPKDNPFIYSENYPVIYFSKEFQKKLAKNAIITTNFEYAKKNLHRIVITAKHTQKDLVILLKAIK